MDTKQLSNFLLVVEKGSVSRAAQDSYITSQAILQQMNALEAEVGVKLLDRSPRGVQCTPAGQFLYEKLSTLDKYFQDVLDECRRIGTESLGTIHIGRSSISIFGSVIDRAFSRAHPTANIEYVDVEAADAYERLLDETIDVAEFGSAPRNLPEGLAYTKIAYFQPMCVMSSDNPLASKELIQIEDLAGQRIGTREGRLTRDPIGIDQLGDAENFEEAPLTKDEAIVFCLDGGVFLEQLPSTAAMFPLVNAPIDHDKIEAGLLSRTDPSPIVEYYLEAAKGAFGSESA